MPELDPPGRTLQVPGVAGSGEVVVGVGQADGELVHHVLAEQDRAGRAEAARDGRVLGRDAVGQDAGAGRRADTGRVKEILEADRDAVERPAVPSAADLLLRSLRLGRGLLGRHCQVAVELVVEPLDPGEIGVDQLHWGDRPPLELRGKALDRRQT